MDMDTNKELVKTAMHSNMTAKEIMNKKVIHRHRKILTLPFLLRHIRKQNTAAEKEQSPNKRATGGIIAKCWVW